MRNRERLHGRSVEKPPRGHPTALVPWSMVAAETPVFQAYRGEVPPRFVNEAELEYAKILDYHGVPWEYEPHTFVLERDVDGRVVEAFTPDFYLPDQDLYLEVTVMKQSLVTRKNRKLRRLRELHPELNVKILYRRDYLELTGTTRLLNLLGAPIDLVGAPRTA